MYIQKRLQDLINWFRLVRNTVAAKFISIMNFMYMHVFMCFLCPTGCINLSIAKTVCNSLLQSLDHLVLSSDLHLLNLVVPHDILETIQPNWTVYFEIVNQLMGSAGPQDYIWFIFFAHVTNWLTADDNSLTIWNESGWAPQAEYWLSLKEGCWYGQISCECFDYIATFH